MPFREYMLLLYESKIDSQSNKMRVEVTPGVKING